MKRPIPIVPVLFFAATNFVLAQTGITGSAHDFSGQGWGTTEICQPCHAPHNTATITDAPLWNHQTTVTVFTPYSSSTLHTTTITQPDASSKLCLSCHDGTVALENFGGTTTGTHFIGGDGNVGTSLANDHPISFTYNTALATADGGLWDPATRTTGLGSSISNDLLIGGKLQCASCHDVHRAYANSHLLKIGNNASALCLTCHKK